MRMTLARRRSSLSPTQRLFYSPLVWGEREGLGEAERRRREPSRGAEGVERGEAVYPSPLEKGSGESPEKN